jgi:predicted RNase H-like nuclease (RuvC/YqgF family)
MSKKNTKKPKTPDLSDESSEEEFDLEKLTEPDAPEENTEEKNIPKPSSTKSEHVKSSKGKAKPKIKAIKRTVPIDYATNKALSMSVKELTDNLITLGKKYETLESRYEQMQNSEETKTASEVKKAAMDARLYFQSLSKR